LAKSGLPLSDTALLFAVCFAPLFDLCFDLLARLSGSSSLLSMTPERQVKSHEVRRFLR
jgi:hypothetical protein